MGARIGGGLGELGHDMRGGRQVGIAHAEVDDVLSGATSSRLHRVHFGEHIGRQALQPVKFGVVHIVLLGHLGGDDTVGASQHLFLHLRPTARRQFGLGGIGDRCRRRRRSPVGRRREGLVGIGGALRGAAGGGTEAGAAGGETGSGAAEGGALEGGAMGAAVTGPGGATGAETGADRR